ncbi:MAG TPA: CehA/McbA family metallohydrolase [Planctomycetaceae bacterium]|nr:CehA/McbA family metallohydrolase [Planctomycetaceae bacterium]
MIVSPRARLFLVFLLILTLVALQATGSHSGLHAAGPQQKLPLVIDVEQQPLVSATHRLTDALSFVGAPLKAEDKNALEAACADADAKQSLRTIQAVLDPYCLVGVTINPESRVSVVEGPAGKELIQQGWRTFLVKVQNQAGITATLRPESPNLAPVYLQGRGERQHPLTNKSLEIAPEALSTRFLDIQMYDKQPLKPQLSGLGLEYRIVNLYSRDRGKREAVIGFNVGQGTQDLGFRNTVPILFDCQPAVKVALGVKDSDGKPTTASFVVRDKHGHVYPNPARRLAPDFFFHDQVYRADGESLDLPPGEYAVEYNRGPEYLVETKTITVHPGTTQQENFELKRWIHPATRQWFSGDHHVHAAGCAHYDSPTEGVTPADMMRHVVGEDLNVGCVLSWGPCWYTQKQYFEGKVSALSKPNYLMRYDVEVSGFPSSHAGHLCLLRLKEDDYPGTKVIEEWPSWTQPVLDWGKKQDAVVGYSHSGWGLELPDYLPDGRRAEMRRRGQRDPQAHAADKLPDYAMPRFDGIGANEFIVTGPNGVCDFISTVDTPPVWELNIWYHMLNCGVRTRISGETDFPCIYGDKVGLGRIYVKLKPEQPLDYDTWILGVRDGRSYCGDGRSHLFDFKVNDLPVGESGPDGKISQLSLAKPGKVKVTLDVAARLEEKPTPKTEKIRSARLDQKPYWHVERARIGETRKVPVELIVNGQAVARQEIVADGETRPLSFDFDIPQSSWIAVRIFPSVHTNPVFVEVAGKPIRASRKSAEWCRRAVDVCWRAKSGQIRQSERDAAEAAYDSARKYYDKVQAESQVD